MDLMEQLKLHYGINFIKIDMLRDWIGQVYEASCENNRYIVKLFRKEHTRAALQSAEVMTYLRDNHFPVPDIISTSKGSKYFVYEDRIAILYEYIGGEVIDHASNLSEVGRQFGWMKRLMESYDKEIDCHGYDFFIKRYLDIMKRKSYQGIDKFTELGNTLWDKVKDLPTGFIHGDFHAGNMFLDKANIIFFDFDACAVAYPVYDIATYCDATDYFNLSEDNFKQGFIQTQKNVTEFLNGYNNYFSLSKKEEKAVYYFIAIRHFDIQATIIASQGPDCVDAQFLDDQYLWLKKWLMHIPD